MWGGRFSKQMDDRFAYLNASLRFDWRLYAADIRGSRAYARALARAHLISEMERDALVDGLTRVEQEFDAGTFAAQPSDEDIHTAVERRLGELVGAVAGKLHTGRSRNDQVATDTRLFVLDTIRNLQFAIRNLQSAILEKSEQQLDVLMPGYTHLQRAQPILFSHWLMAYFWMLERDHARLRDCATRVSVLPLGAGALAGNALGIDRDFLARELGFARVSDNSIDAVSDRDFIAEFLFAAALIGAHLSRLGEDLVLYSSAEFGFVTLDDAYATGSSLMPQKKNPDAMELARGKAGRLIGDLMSLLVVLKGLPSSYNKDLQEDKEPLFDAVDTLDALLPVVAGVIRTLRVHADKMRAALDAAMLATDLADYLVRRGVPFRDAHRRVGEAVKLAETRGIALADLSLDAYKTIAPEFDAALKDVFDFARALAARETVGGTGPGAVRAQIGRAKGIIKE
ncbi:MAG: argininosuccinate lyase [Chloroflexi bacterium]|nr:argininosuccinate lyase [Chloroflexota bacterium]